MYKEDIDTPSLVVDLDIMEKNIRNMSNYFIGKKTVLRPHGKSCKTPAILKKQLKLPGAKGVTVAKVSEAEVMFFGGIDDILIANEIVGPRKIRRLINLAKHAHMMVAIDNFKNAKELSKTAEKKGVTLDVLVDINIGINRCGVEPGEPALDLVRKAAELKGLKFKGLMAYEGGLYQFPKFKHRKKEAWKRIEQARKTKAMLEKESFNVDVFSSGGTCTYNITSEIPDVTEIEAGSYLLMDAHDKFGMEGLDAFDCAAFVLTTVMSKPTNDRAIVDMGSKAIGYYCGELPPTKDMQGVKINRLNEEHGIVDLKNPSETINIGDKLEFYPSHICATVNLYDKLYGIRDNEIEVIWNIPARGKSQ